MESVLDLIDNCKYLDAYSEYKVLLEKVSEGSGLSVDEKNLLNDQINTNKNILDMMVDRAKQVQATLDFEDNEQWTLGANLFGITTHYRKSGDADDSIVLKMEGVMDNIPLFETLAVLHEIDLYKDWVPFCGESYLMHKFSVADVMGYVNMGFPLFSRDTLVRAYGTDLLASHGKMIMIGNSILDYKGDLKVPFKKINWVHNRIDLKEFQFVIDVLSPTSVKTSIIAHVNLNTKLPQTLINFLMKNLAGILLNLFNRQVLHVSKTPTCTHAERIRSNKEFYRDWLLPRFRAYCDLKGWEQPTISSLGEEGNPPPLAGALKGGCTDASSEKEQQQQTTAENTPCSSERVMDAAEVTVVVA